MARRHDGTIGFKILAAGVIGLELYELNLANNKSDPAAAEQLREMSRAITSPDGMKDFAILLGIAWCIWYFTRANRKRRQGNGSVH